MEKGRRKQLDRYHWLKMVRGGMITLVEASAKMGVSYRQARRLKKAFISGGIKLLARGNWGQPLANKIDEQLKSRIIALSADLYSKLNDTHVAEMLVERGQISISREGVRSIVRLEGIPPKKKRRDRKHHRRRAPKECDGLMVLWNGSPHRWFGREHPPWRLMAAIDDATGKALALLFAEVRQLLEGSRKVYYRDEPIAIAPASQVA